MVLILHIAVCFFVWAISSFFVASCIVIFFFLKFAEVNDSHKVSGGSLNRDNGLDTVGISFVSWEVRGGRSDDSAL